MLKDKLKTALMVILILTAKISAQKFDYQNGYESVNGISMYYEIYGDR